MATAGNEGRRHSIDSYRFRGRQSTEHRNGSPDHDDKATGRDAASDRIRARAFGTALGVERIGGG